MLKTVELARRLAPLPRALLLVGESGVGKGLLARFIHAHSGRLGDFVALAGGELSESLLHDQLVGHEPGAFTGAARRLRGPFERAQNGTLFLDELPLWPRADHGGTGDVGAAPDVSVARERAPASWRGRVGLDPGRRRRGGAHPGLRSPVVRRGG